MRLQQRLSIFSYRKSGERHSDRQARHTYHYLGALLFLDVLVIGVVESHAHGSQVYCTRR